MTQVSSLREAAIKKKFFFKIAFLQNMNIVSIRMGIEIFSFNLK